jgi:phage tail sheath protein FI
MPVVTTYPGVYIEEIPSGVRTIIGVSTSITAFAGRALKGPTNEPVMIHSFADYERIFGGLWVHSTMSYAVQQYFLNGGTDAVIVRLARNAAKAGFVLSPNTGSIDLLLEAKSEGAWGNNLQINIDHNTRDLKDNEIDNLKDKIFNISIEETDPAKKDPVTEKKQVRSKEAFLNVTIDPDDTRFIGKVLAQESNLVQLSDSYADGSTEIPSVRPAEISYLQPSTKVTDGDELTAEEYVGSAKKGIYALEKTDIFNLMCIPPLAPGKDVDSDTWAKALTFCKERRAFLIIDPPSDWNSTSDVQDPLTGVGNLRGGFPDYAAIYFPRVKMSDPLKENRLEVFVPCGVVAGIYARTDAQRGIWKAPAGTDTAMAGVKELTVKLTDRENGELNPLGVNCLRNFPVVNNIVWGARTLAGADRMASEWKYIPVRRLALYIEESLYRGTQWVVFEPNDEPLWAQIRLNVGAFMNGLFRQGAFQGRTPREAYFVKCDKETTTQADINQGIVNILVGFAPLKPAEFVIIKISQIAGEIQT